MSLGGLKRTDAAFVMLVGSDKRAAKARAPSHLPLLFPLQLGADEMR